MDDLREIKAKNEKKSEKKWINGERIKGVGRAGDGGNLPLMTRLIFFQRLGPVTTEHLVPHSYTHPHTRTRTHAHTYACARVRTHTHKTLCPDLHVCLLVHTGSNDTRASHRSILDCHSVGKRAHTCTGSHKRTHT